MKYSCDFKLYLHLVFFYSLFFKIIFYLKVLLNCFRIFLLNLNYILYNNAFSDWLIIVLFLIFIINRCIHVLLIRVLVLRSNLVILLIFRYWISYLLKLLFYYIFRIIVLFLMILYLAISFKYLLFKFLDLFLKWFYFFFFFGPDFFLNIY